MQTDTRLGSFQAVVEAAPQHSDMLNALRTLAHELHPGGMEFASIKERSVSWGYGQSKMTTWYAYVMAHTHHVNLGFFHGTSLPDPEALLEGTGETLRHVKLKTVAAVQHPAVRALMIAARDERSANLAAPA